MGEDVPFKATFDNGLAKSYEINTDITVTGKIFDKYDLPVGGGTNVFKLVIDGDATVIDTAGATATGNALSHTGAKPKIASMGSYSLKYTCELSGGGA
jgi:hypothetical protein